VAEERAKRKLTAILSADVKGYSRLMADDEEATVRTINDYRKLITDLISEQHGRVVDAKGDNVLAEFASVVDAVRCGVEIQKELKTKNADLLEHRKMEFRIGVNLGDVIEEKEIIYGDGVNVAARLESLADAGSLCISGTAFDQVRDKLNLGYEYLGEQSVKNIPRPIRTYKVLTEGEHAGQVIGEAKQKPEPWRWAGASIAIVILAIGVFAVWHYYFRPDVEPASLDKMAYPLPDKPSIAVLPFDNMTGDPDQEYFSDGITEEIITALCKIPKLFVIARNSTFTYKGKPVKVQQVSEELGVQYVVEGSIRGAKDRVRITAQLIDALTGRHIWADKFDRDIQNIFAVQDEITKKIITALQVNLTDGEQAAVYSRGTNNLEAYLKIMKANWLYSQMAKTGVLKARQLANEAIALDPGYAAAYTLLGRSHGLVIQLGFSKNPRESLKRAIESFHKAIELDDSFAIGHVALGFWSMYARQYDKALAEGKRGFELGSNSAEVIAGYAAILTMIGRPEEAIPFFKEALRLNPKPPSYYLHFLGIALRDSGQYEDAVIQARKAIEKEPNNLIANVVLTSSLSLAGRDEEARKVAKEILRINPKFSVSQWQKRSPHKNRAVAKRYCDALRKAGLPDKPPLPLPDKPSIAVLPFVNMSGDPEQEYFSDGITEEIITALSKTDKLFVIARNSSFTYKGKPVRIPTVGKELGVRYVLEGSVRRSEDRLRITAQLIDARTGNHVWAHRYDRDLKDIFDIQDEITMRIITALQVKLTEGEQARVWGRSIDKLDVYSKFLEARSLWDKGTPKSHARFGQVAQDIIDMDPGVGVGYSLMAWHCWYLAKMGKSPRENIRKAFTLAQKALSIDESNSGTHALLGSLYLLMRQYDKAIVEGERSVELDPNGAIAHGLLGMTLAFSDRPDEAIMHLKQAIRLNPFPPYWYYARLGQSYMQKGEYEEALQMYQKGLKSNPEAFTTYAHLAALYVLMNREEEGRAAAKKVFELYPRFSLDGISKTLTFKNKDFFRLFVGAMRKAGLE